MEHLNPNPKKLSLINQLKVNKESGQNKKNYEKYHCLINELVNISQNNIMSEFAVEKSLTNKSLVNPIL